MTRDDHPGDFSGGNFNTPQNRKYDDKSDFGSSTDGTLLLIIFKIKVARGAGSFLFNIIKNNLHRY